jgi:hypothetical protein
MGASTSRFFEKVGAKLTYDPELEKQLASEKQNARKARTTFQQFLVNAQTKNDTLIKQNKLTPEGATLTAALFKQTNEWLTQNATATEAEITEKQQNVSLELAELYVEDKSRLYYLNVLNFVEATLVDYQARNKISNEVYEKTKEVLNKEKVWYNQHKSESMQTYKAQVDEIMEKIYAALNDPGLAKPLKEGLQKVDSMEDSTEIQELKAAAQQAQRDKETIEKQTFSPSRVTSRVSKALMISFFVALYIAAGLYGGSMAANDAIVRPTSIRILYFIFGFIFWLPVLIYFGVRTWGGHPPHFATFLPLYEYDPNTEAKTLLTSLFYYTDSPIIRLAKEKFAAAATAAQAS